MTLPTRADGYTILDDDWNAHVSQINANTSGISSNTSTIASHTSSLSSHNTRISDLESGHYARYYAGVGQGGIATGVDTKVQFTVGLHTSSDVTASGTGNQTFTLNKAGIWSVSTGVRGGGVTFTGSPTGERLVAITNGGTTSSDRYVAYQGYRITGQIFLTTVALQRRFSIGDQISITYKHDSGATGTVESSGEQTSISLSWLRA